MEGIGFPQNTPTAAYGSLKSSEFMEGNSKGVSSFDTVIRINAENSGASI